MHSFAPRFRDVVALFFIAGVFPLTGCTLRLSFDDSAGGKNPPAGVNTSQSMARLETLLQSSDPQVRSIAAVELGALGPKARDATGELSKLVNDPDRHVRFAAARALGQISPDDPATVPTLVMVIDDSQMPREDRKAAVMQLGGMGASAASARPAIERLQQSDDADIRDASTTALNKIDAVMTPRSPATQPATQAADWFDSASMASRAIAATDDLPKPDLHSGNIQHYSPSQFEALRKWIHRQSDLTPAQQQANIERFDEWNREQEQKIAAVGTPAATRPSANGG